MNARTRGRDSRAVRGRWGRAVSIVLLAGAATAARGEAQTLGLDAATRDLPRWMEAWSPLAPAPGERAQALPSTGAALPMLLVPVPRVGLLWNAGQVAALPREVREARANVLLSRGERSGDFRRPLDAPTGDATRMTAIAWRPVGERSAMVGRVAVSRDARDPSPWRVDPDVYGASPFAVVDTSRAGDRQVRIRLDGAAGWRLGQWSVGVGGGYETLDQRTDFSAIGRGARRASTALTAGAVRRLGTTDVGLQLGWRVDGTTVNVREGVPGSSPVVYELFGLRDVPPASTLGGYSRRTDVTRPTVALALAGEAWGGRWSASAAAGRRTERHRRQSNSRAPYDEWTADGASLDAAYQHAIALPLLGEALLTAQARTALLDGSATLDARPGLTMYTARDVGMGAEVELRFPAAADGSASPWSAALAAGVTQARREQADSNATLRAELETLSPTLRVEVERALTSRLRLGGGVAMTSLTSRGEIPIIQTPGVAYRDLVGPNLGLASSDARPLAASILLRWLEGDRSYWLAGRLERVEPADVDGGPPLLAPTGRRTLRALVLGMTVMTARPGA